MKKNFILIFALGTANYFAQVQQQQPLPQQNFFRGNTLNTNDNDLNVQQRASQVFASNINISNVKINTIKANPVVVNTNKTNVKPIVQGNINRPAVRQRHQVRNNGDANNEGKNDINSQNFINVPRPEIQTNLGNKFIIINDDNINIQLLENNIEMPQIQAAAPQMQLGGGNSGGNGFSLNINLPKLNLPTLKLKAIKFSGGSSHSSHHKKFNLKKRLIKFDRKWHAKFDSKKRLRIKVDNCFKW